MHRSRPLRFNLVRLADLYGRATGRARATVSSAVLKRGATLAAIENGTADVTTATYEAAVIWFAANWPAGLPWPEGIERPVVEPAP